MVISVKGINKKYGDVLVLRNITIDELTSGSYVGLLGKNGAGKTTLFNILIDLISPDSGHLLFNGETILPDSKKWKQTLGIVSNEIPLIEDFTGKDFLKFTGLLYNLKQTDIDARVNTLTNFFFDDFTILQKKVGAYSLGTKKKILLCASVLHRPNILILDEPFSGLDVEGIERVVDFLELYQKNGNNIVLIASHNMAYITKLLTRVLVIDAGAIIYDNNLSEFTNNGAHVLDEALFNFVTHKRKSVEELSWINE